MYHLGRLFLFFLLLFLSSCLEKRKADPPVEKTMTSGPAIREFRVPIVLLLYPDLHKADSMKKVMGTDSYHELSDRNAVYFHELRTLLQQQGIHVLTGEDQFYRFISGNGAVTEINLSGIALPWQVILFNGIDSPSVVSPDKAKSRLSSLFPLLETKKAPGKTITLKERTIFGHDTLSENIKRDADFIMPDKTDGREITIRLILPPGHFPVSDRHETEGFRVISSFINPASRFWLRFDNDIFSYTDRYYTNGVELGYTAPWLVNMPLNFLMLSFNRNSVVQSSLSLHHAMYTPYTTKTPPLLRDDRPYASTLFLRYSQTSDDAVSGLRLTTSIDAGVIGDAALGRAFQKSVHSGIPTNDEPLGWETQIKNDLVLTYSVNLQKQIYKGNHSEVLAHGTATAGTLYTRAGMGLDACIGLFSPGITPLPLTYNELSPKEKVWQYGLRGGFEFRATAYDATLQGGVFNNKNIYALKPDETERIGASAHLGLFARYRKMGVSISQFYLSREFKAGHRHFWGQIGLDYNW